MKIYLARNLKKYRLQQGWTQKELAKKSGVPLSILTKVEHGFSTQPTIQTVVKIADALKISLDKLVGRNVKE